MINAELRELINDENVLNFIGDDVIVELSDDEDRRITKLVTPGYENRVVWITRGHGDMVGTLISVDFLENTLKWSDECGGTHKKHAGFSLYATIWYKLAKFLNIECSGEHDTDRNPAKVLICASHNNADEYRAGYQHLLEHAPKKPECHYRQPSLPPCTKRIEELLQENARSRGELRAILGEQNYPIKMIGNALNRLKREGRISWEGSSSSPRQMIFLSTDSHE